MASGSELQLDGSLTIGNEALSVNGQGYQNRTAAAGLFVGAVHAVSGKPLKWCVHRRCPVATWGTVPLPGNS